MIGIKIINIDPNIKLPNYISYNRVKHLPIIHLTHFPIAILACRLLYCQMLCLCLCLLIVCLSYTWHIVGVANGLREQPVPDLPGEDGGALPLVLRHLANHPRRRHTRFRTPDGPGFNRTRLIVSNR